MSSYNKYLKYKNKYIRLKNLVGGCTNCDDQTCLDENSCKHKCANCKIIDKTRILSICSKCRKVYYCSKKCQIDHWKTSHKIECTPPETLPILLVDSFPNKSCKDKSCKDKSCKDKSIEQECSNCGQHEQNNMKLLKCGRCNLTSYCSISCQYTDWSFHKLFCITPDKRTPSSINKTDSHSDKTSGIECSICLDQIKECDKSTLICKHYFHIKCIDAHRRVGKSLKCPLCNAGLGPRPDTLHETAIRTLEEYTQNPGSKNHDKLKLSLKIMKVAADQGNYDALYSLAIIYSDNKFIQKNIKDTMYLFKIGADRGYKDMQYDYATLLYTGKEVQNIPEAFKYFKLAAEQGHQDAMYKCENMFNSGEIEIDSPTKFDFYTQIVGYKSTDKSIEGTTHAMNNAGIMLLIGDGIDQDLQRAKKLFEDSMRYGNYSTSFLHSCISELEVDPVNTQLKIGKHYLKQNNNKNAVIWLTKAVNTPSPSSEAQFILGQLYYEGTKVDKNVILGLDLIKKAANMGFNDAKTFLIKNKISL